MVHPRDCQHLHKRMCLHEAAVSTTSGLEEVGMTRSGNTVLASLQSSLQLPHCQIINPSHFTPKFYFLIFSFASRTAAVQKKMPHVIRALFGEPHPHPSCSVSLRHPVDEQQLGVSEAELAHAHGARLPWCRQHVWAPPLGGKPVAEFDLSHIVKATGSLVRQPVAAECLRGRKLILCDYLACLFCSLLSSACRK